MAAQWPPKYIPVWLVSMGARPKIYSILVGKWERYMASGWQGERCL